MEQRGSSQEGHRKIAHNPLTFDWEKLRRNSKDDKLRRKNSVKNHSINVHDTGTDGYLCPYRKSMPCRPVKLEVQEGGLQRRGSVYQSSQDVSKLKNLHNQMRNVDLTNGNKTFLSFDIVDSSTLNYKTGNTRLQLGEKSNTRLQLGEKSTHTSSHASPALSPLETAQIAPGNSSDFLDLSFRVLLEEKPTDNCPVKRRDTMLDDLLEITLSSNDECSKATEKLVGKSSTERPKLSGKISVSLNDDVGTSKRDKAARLPKSFSAKVGGITPQNQEYSGAVTAVRVTPKTRFGPLTRVLDPLVKSKSLRNPSLLEAENGSTQTVDCIMKTITARNSSLSEAVGTPCRMQKIDCKEPLLESVEEAVILSSPVHLNATLRLENKNKMSPFVFSLNDTCDVYYAKTWRTSSPFDWVYTFHSNKRKPHSAPRGVKEGQKQGSLMIGQMQVSCYLCSEVGSTGTLDNYTALEFVLYDISQSRSSAIGDRKNCHLVESHHQSGGGAESLATFDAKKPDIILNSKKVKVQDGQALGDCDLDSSDLHPWAPTDLHPHLEVAAVVIQIPFDNKERVRVVHSSDLSKRCRNIPNEFLARQCKSTPLNNLHPVNMKVITPSGKHGLPSTEGCPSPLLYRWRSGGRCDCGGWDMGCPIAVLAANSSDRPAEFSLKKCHRSIRLDAEGSKDTIPALLIKMSVDGEYSVNFHAQFSAVQAFSISIAVLHLLESFRTDYGENLPILHSSSLKVLLEEELRQLLDSVAEEEKMKEKDRVVRPTPLYRLLDPPFSPIARV